LLYGDLLPLAVAPSIINSCAMKAEHSAGRKLPNCAILKMEGVHKCAQCCPQISTPLQEME